MATGGLKLSLEDLSDVEHTEKPLHPLSASLPSHLDTSTSTLQYEHHSLSNQLLVLGRAGVTLTEEEEPVPELPEEPLPYGLCCCSD